MDSDSGSRLGGTLLGIDTPTLLGTWSSAPYLHDGSAATVEEAISAHNTAAVSVAEVSALADFVRQISPLDAIRETDSVISNTVSALALDGNLDDWAGANSFGIDPQDIIGASNPLDWREGWMAHDSENLYLSYRNYGALTSSWGQSVYLDTDASTTTGYRQGELGIDYLFQSRYVYRYTGTGNDWSWEFVTSMTGTASSEAFEYSLPRRFIGSPEKINLAFIGENVAYTGTEVDFYPNGFYTDGSLERYFSYFFNNASAPTLPVAISQSLSGSVGETIAVTLTGSDFSNSSLSYEVVTNPQYGQLTGNPPALQYTPSQGYSGSDSFSFRVKNSTEFSSIAIVSIEVNAVDGEEGAGGNFSDGIQLDGDLSDWAALQSFGLDPDDVSASDSPIDFLEASVAHDNDYFYLSYRNDGGNLQSIGEWGFNLYIDADQLPATGYGDGLPIGAEYLLQGDVIYRYTGDGASWAWEAVTNVERVVSGSVAELRFPRSSFGSVTKFDLFFVGDNLAIGGSQDDF